MQQMTLRLAYLESWSKRYLAVHQLIFIEFLSYLKINKLFQDGKAWTYFWNPWFSEGKVRTQRLGTRRALETVGFLS